MLCFALLIIAAEKLQSYHERTVSLASSLTHLINLFPSWVSFEEEEEEDPTMALVHTTRSVVVRSLFRGRSPSQQPQWCRLFSDDAHGGAAKVPIWQDPTSPSKWKEEHFVFVSLAGWGALFYSGYKYFTSGSTTPKSAKEEEEATASKRDHHADPKTEKGKH